MKMPDSCASCQFCLDGILDDHDEPCTACELIADNTPWGCGYKIIDGIDYDKERMYFCPLTPLPEHHGDLVDVNEIRWDDHYDSDGNLSKYKIAYSDEMPDAIVEAE